MWFMNERSLVDRSLAYSRNVKKYKKTQYWRIVSDATVAASSKVAFFFFRFPAAVSG